MHKKCRKIVRFSSDCMILLKKCDAYENLMMMGPPHHHHTQPIGMLFSVTLFICSPQQIVVVIEKEVARR